jgi:hypothetical protein
VLAITSVSDLLFTTPWVLRSCRINERKHSPMWPLFPAIAIIVVQASEPASPSKPWCFERGPGARLCETTQAECIKLRSINTEIATSECKRGDEPPQIRESPTEPPAPPNPAKQTPTQR